MGLYPSFSLPVPDTDCQLESIVPNFSIRVVGGGWRFGARVNYNSRFPLPRDPATNEEWQVGFIQNVLSDNCTCRYASGNTVRINHQTPKLDAERPGNQAWVNMHAITVVQDSPRITIHPWIPIIYGRGQATLLGNSQVTTFELSMQDYPKTQYYNFFGGASRDQLREVHHRIEFRTWLAAKKVSSRNDDPRSYHLMAVTNPFTLTYDLQIPGLNPAFAAFSRGAVAAGEQGETITRPGVQCYLSDLNWAQARPNTPRPVVSGQTANEELGSLHNRRGVGPLSLWGD